MFLLLSVTFSLVINERYYDNLDSNNKIITVGVAQPNFKTARLINNKDHLVDELVELVIESNNEESDLIILPETIYPYTFNEKNSYTEEYYRTKFDLMSKNNAIIFGGFIKDNSKILNSVIIKEKQSSTFQYIPKTKLLPFGEYIPKIKYFPFFEKIFDEYVPYTANNLTNSIVEQSKTIFINELPININAVICYEVLFQEIVKSKIKNTDLLINLGQGSWFGESVFGVSGPAKWSFVHLRMRAIQNGIPVIRSSNTSGSYYINEKGVVINKIKPLVKGFFYEKVTLNRIETLYSIYGDWFKYVFSIILLLTIIIRKFIF
jgi:apolipoprotein N-acyltransferase